MNTSAHLRPPISPISPLAMDEFGRSMSGLAFDMDPRDPRDPRVMRMPLDPLRMGMEGADYFGSMSMPSFSGRSHGSIPYGLPPFDSDMMGPSQNSVDEVVRRTNLLAQFVNGQISYSARYSQVQPKMCSDGRFPPDFRVPKTVEEVKVMDPSCLDRILRAYGLPTDLRSFQMTSRDSMSPKLAHQAKLCTLFDFLGANQITERLRMKRGAMLQY